MSRIGINFPRTTMLLSSDSLLSAMQRTQFELSRAQQSISTGQSVNRPSDESARTSVILVLESQLEAREQHERNLQNAIGVLNFTDQAINNATDSLIEAQSIASSQIGIGSNEDIRAIESAVVDGMIQGLLNVANRQFQGVSVFGGNQGTPLNENVFEEFLGGIRYVGAQTNLAGDLGVGDPLGFNSNGDDTFGALSNRVLSRVDLDLQATSATRLVDVRGAQGFGVRTGSIVVAVDGTPVTVDLTTVDTLGDVVTRVNDAIDGVDSTAGALAINGSGFELMANPGHIIDIAELRSGETAGDLGIKLMAMGITVPGGDVDPILTALSSLSALGPTIDFAGGLKITQGAHTKIADFSSAVTIQDMMNEINRLRLGLRLQINEAGTGLNLISEVSGLDFSIGETAGGTTAEDLGLRTFGQATLLSDFRFGLGVGVQPGVHDFAVELHDGQVFNVNLDGLTTVGGVLAAINTAAAAGLTVGTPGTAGTDFNVGLAQDGNGFVFEDNTVGGNEFRVVQLGTSMAATHLGIYQNAGTGSTIVGDDLAMVRSESIFTHMINLRDALWENDSFGITLAGDAIEQDIETLARVRADVGVRSQQIEFEQERSAVLKTTELSMLSDLRDTDFTEVVTQFLQLQQQLEASLRVGSQNLQLSFLDFLR